MSELHIVGAGGHAKVVMALALASGQSVAGFYDDGMPPGTVVMGRPVIGGLAELMNTPDTLAIVAIGSNATRYKLAHRFDAVQWATLIHPTAWLAPGVVVGHGSVIMAGCIVQPDAFVQRHAILNTGSCIDHDSSVGDFVHVAPGSNLAGNVRLSQGVFAGIGSAFIPGVEIGEWSMIGAGSVVTKSIPANVTAVGAPAKVIKERPEGWHLL